MVSPSIYTLEFTGLSTIKKKDELIISIKNSI